MGRLVCFGTEKKVNVSGLFCSLFPVNGKKIKLSHCGVIVQEEIQLLLMEAAKIQKMESDLTLDKKSFLQFFLKRTNLYMDDVKVFFFSVSLESIKGITETMVVRSVARLQASTMLLRRTVQELSWHSRYTLDTTGAVVSQRTSSSWSVLSDVTTKNSLLSQKIRFPTQSVWFFFRSRTNISRA